MGHICSYIKVGITGGCAAFMLALSTALRSLMLILASAAFGSLMFAGALSGKHRILLTTHYVNNTTVSMYIAVRITISLAWSMKGSWGVE